MNRRAFLASGAATCGVVFAGCTTKGVNQPSRMDPQSTVKKTTPKNTHLQRDLEFWYRFDEVYFNRGLLEDRTGDGPDAKAYGDIEFRDSAPTETSVTFDGVDDYFEITGKLSSEEQTTFVFFRPGNDIADTRLLSSRNQNGGVRIGISGSESLRFILFDDQGGVSPCKGETALDRDRYYTSTVTWDGESQTIFLDGDLDGVKENDRYTPSNVTPKIGKNATDNRDHFEGDIVAIGHWSRVLNENEIDKLALAEGPLFE